MGLMQDLVFTPKANLGNPIFFDIDGTLVDAEKFGKSIRTSFMKVLKVDEEELARAIADYYAALESTTDFNPKDIVVHISKRYGIDPILLDNVFWKEDKHYKEALYPEVITVLEKLSKENALGIFSQGFEEFQRHKLNASGIISFFKEENIFIYRRKLSDEATGSLPRTATVIDDNHEVVLKLSDYVGAIWMNRRTEDDDAQVKTIHSLSELTNNI